MLEKSFVDGSLLLHEFPVDLSHYLLLLHGQGCSSCCQLGQHRVVVRLLGLHHFLTYRCLLLAKLRHDQLNVLVSYRHLSLLSRRRHGLRRRWTVLSASPMSVVT